MHVPCVRSTLKLKLPQLTHLRIILYKSIVHDFILLIYRLSNIYLVLLDAADGVKTMYVLRQDECIVFHVLMVMALQQL